MNPVSWTQEKRGFYTSKLTYEDKINIYIDKKGGMSIGSLSSKYKVSKNIINYRIGCYAKHGRMVTNSPRNKNFQWFGTGNGLCKRKNSRKANVGLRFSGEKTRASVVLSY